MARLDDPLNWPIHSSWAWQAAFFAIAFIISAINSRLSYRKYKERKQRIFKTLLIANVLFLAYFLNGTTNYMLQTPVESWSSLNTSFLWMINVILVLLATLVLTHTILDRLGKLGVRKNLVVGLKAFNIALRAVTIIFRILEYSFGEDEVIDAIYSSLLQFNTPLTVLANLAVNIVVLRKVKQNADRFAAISNSSHNPAHMDKAINTIKICLISSAISDFVGVGLFALDYTSTPLKRSLLPRPIMAVWPTLMALHLLAESVFQFALRQFFRQTESDAPKPSTAASGRSRNTIGNKSSDVQSPNLPLSPINPEARLINESPQSDNSRRILSSAVDNV